MTAFICQLPKLRGHLESPGSATQPRAVGSSLLARICCMRSRLALRSAMGSSGTLLFSSLANECLRACGAIGMVLPFVPRVLRATSQSEREEVTCACDPRGGGLQAGGKAGL